MNSDVRSDADAPTSARITEGKARDEIHEIVEQSWASLARSLADDLPNELGEFIQKSIDEVFARHLSGVVSPDLIEQLKSECIRRINDYLRQALRDGVFNRHQAQLRVHIDDLLDEEFAEKRVSPRRRRAEPIPAEPPAAGAEAAEIAEEDARSTIDIGGTLAGGLPKPAAPQARPAAPAPAAPAPAAPAPAAPAPAPGRGYAPAPADAASDVLKVERGKLVEKIPRTMYLGVREIVEVRLGLPTQDLTEGLAGSGVLNEHGIWMVETMSIKLVSPDDAFDIEARSPEVQLVKKEVLKGTPLEGLVANFGQWIWTVTPKQRGSHPLELSISASVRDARGVPGSATLPNQSIPIEVAVSLTVTSRRLFWWILSAGASGAFTTLVGAITRDYWWPVLKNWLSLP